MKLRSKMKKVGGIDSILKLNSIEKKLPKLVRYDMAERDVQEWEDTKKEFAKKYGLKKIVTGKKNKFSNLQKWSKLRKISRIQMNSRTLSTF